MTESPQTQQVSAYPEPGFAKTSLVGALTAIVATLPVSILKTMAALSRLCLPVGASRSDAPITLSTCGVFYNTWNADTTSFLLYLLFVLLGGAFFGVIASGQRCAQARQAPPHNRPKGPLAYTGEASRVHCSLTSSSSSYSSTLASRDRMRLTCRWS